jgi:hypothetical protein
MEFSAHDRARLRKKSGVGREFAPGSGKTLPWRTK